MHITVSSFNTNRSEKTKIISVISPQFLSASLLMSPHGPYEHRPFDPSAGQLFSPSSPAQQINSGTHRCACIVLMKEVFRSGICLHRRYDTSKANAITKQDARCPPLPLPSCLLASYFRHAPLIHQPQHTAPNTMPSLLVIYCYKTSVECPSNAISLTARYLLRKLESIKVPELGMFI